MSGASTPGGRHGNDTSSGSVKSFARVDSDVTSSVPSGTSGLAGGTTFTVNGDLVHDHDCELREFDRVERGVAGPRDQRDDLREAAMDSVRRIAATFP